MSRRKWTAAEVVHALRRSYAVADSAMVTDEWAFLTEIPLRAPSARMVMGKVHDDSYWANTRTIDVLLVRNWSSGIGFRRVAVEVKVSRSDYRNETDQKRAPAEAAAHQTYYAAPAGIIDPLTLPPGWGLFEVYPDREAYDAGKGWEHGSGRGLVRVRKRPIERSPTCGMDYLVSACARRASRLAERIRRGEDDAAEVAALRREVESMAGKLERRDSTLTRVQQEMRGMRSLLAAMDGGQVCADCGQPVRYASSTGGRWVHEDPAQEKVCADARTEADRVRRESRYGARYVHGWAGPVVPKSIREQELPENDEATL